MPYKIYTYEDPYSLNKTDFWKEIKDLPHFCVSRTLVNGFVDLFQESIEGLICPLDSLVSHEKVFKSWTDNISLRLQQYSALTVFFNEKFDQKVIDKAFFDALKQNQNQFLDAIRLFLELGISACALEIQKGNKEQRLFVMLLKEIQTSDIEVFKFPTNPGYALLHEIFVDLAKNELKEYKNKRDATEPNIKKINWFERAIANTESAALNTIVIHGVHQFSPSQLRLIIAMEKLGFTIIFLFNYQKKYSELYSSWQYIYQHFDTPIHHDSVITEYKLSVSQNSSNALAMAIGELSEGNFPSKSDRFKEWHKLFCSSELREFAHITEYAHFISDHFNNAIRRYHDDLNIIDRGNGQWNNSAVLRYMDEQVYTANRDVHNLLKIYYPEYSKDRHFLSYPIGQFFSAVYRLWSWERGEINMDEKAIKECLSSGMLSSGRAEELLRTYYNISIVMETAGTFSDFETKIKKYYLTQYDIVATAKSQSDAFPLKHLSIFNPYKVQKAEIETLIKAIEEINTIAVQIFSIGNPQEDYINFGKHFQNLQDFIKKRQSDLVNEEEQALIAALLFRFDQVTQRSTSFAGTFNDLREGLHFYLKQKNEDSNVDWIVKNFEQIDGDILQSKGQFERGEKKVYHFACLSDRDLNSPIDDLLPWPLSDNFIREAYSSKDLQFQVYYSALGERSNFLRYALFYGLYFNRCAMRLSYVKQYGDETTELFALLKILGIKPNQGSSETVTDTLDVGLTIKSKEITTIKYDQYQMGSMFLCPYRYFLEYVLNNDPIIQDEFLYHKFYENILIEAVWGKISGLPKQIAEENLEKIIVSENANISKYFWFWKSTEIYDLELRAKNYLFNRIIKGDANPTVRRFEESHMKIRRLFGKAMYQIDISAAEPQNPYSDFEMLAEHNFPLKKYSLYSLPQNKNQGKIDKKNSLNQATLQYLNQTHNVGKASIVADWCMFCTNKGVCLDSFLMGE